MPRIPCHVIAFVTATLLLAACGGSESGGPTCTPNSQQECQCADGTIGFQSCDADGASFSECKACGLNGTSSGGTSSGAPATSSTSSGGAGAGSSSGVVNGTSSSSSSSSSSSGTVTSSSSSMNTSGGGTPGDTCGAAIPLTLTNGSVTVDGSNRGMADDFGALRCTATTASPDVVYRVQLDVWSRIDVTVTGQGGFQPRVYVWSSCAPPAEVGCRTSDSVATLSATPAPPGDAYIIVEARAGAVVGDFQLTATVHPYEQGDICEWPLDLPVSPARAVGLNSSDRTYFRVQNPDDIQAWAIGDVFDPPSEWGNTDLWYGCDEATHTSPPSPQLLDDLVLSVDPPGDFHIVHGGEGTCDDPRELTVGAAGSPQVDIADARSMGDYVKLECTGNTRRVTVYRVSVTSGSTLRVNIRPLPGSYVSYGVALRPWFEGCDADPPPDDACSTIPVGMADFPVSAGTYALYVYNANTPEMFELTAWAE